jgi:hypothetical protein
MQGHDSRTIERSQHVHGLCREVGELVERSRKQRRVIDMLLSQLETVLRSAGIHRAARGGTHSAGSSPW